MSTTLHQRAMSLINNTRGNGTTTNLVELSKNNPAIRIVSAKLETAAHLAKVGANAVSINNTDAQRGIRDVIYVFDNDTIDALAKEHVAVVSDLVAERRYNDNLKSKVNRIEEVNASLQIQLAMTANKLHTVNSHWLVKFAKRFGMFKNLDK